MLIGAAACGGGGNNPSSVAITDGDLSSLAGDINIDGSSTVGPISEAVAEEFGNITNVRVSVGISGTGGGFEKFCRGETDINDASRPIKRIEEEACNNEDIEFVEFKIAIDGLTIIVHPDNDFASCLTWSQLRKIWDFGSTVTKWSDVDPSFPDEEIKLFGPGADSGTFDYFTEEINGKLDQIRGDFTSSEDDNILVQAVANEPGAMGYLGYAYYQESAGKLKAVALDKDQDKEGAPIPTDSRKGCIEPGDEAITNNTYSLSRPLFMYVSTKALEQQHVQEFLRFYLKEAPRLVSEVGYIALDQPSYNQQMAKFEGSIK